MPGPVPGILPADGALSLKTVIASAAKIPWGVDSDQF
jgi:hypothetical protein